MRFRRDKTMKRRTRERGFALILALLVLSILVVVVVQFTYTVQVENRIVKNMGDDQELSVAARGAIAYVSALFRDDDKNGKTPANVDSLADCWNDPHLPDLLKFQLGDTQIELKIEDLDRRISLDWFTIDQRQAFATAAVRRLLDRVGADGDHDKISKAIRDKVREIAGLPAIADGTPGQPQPPQPSPSPVRANNSTNPLDQPPPKRGILDLSQLMDLEIENGDIRKILWGDPTVQPPKSGIAPFLTCWCTDTINVNTAPAEVLYAILPEKNGTDQKAVSLWDDANAKQVVEGIQKRRIDPYYVPDDGAPAANGSGGNAKPSPSPSPVPSPGASGQGGSGASKSWQGTPYEKVTDLKDIALLAPLFGGTTAANGSNPTPTPTPAPSPAAKPGTGTTFDFKACLAVFSRYYAVEVKATSSGGATKTVRMVLARNGSDEVTPLLIREDPR